MKRINSLVLLVALAAVVTPVTVTSQMVPDLSGSWKLNEEESDNPRESLKEGRMQDTSLPAAGDSWTESGRRR